VQTQKTGFKTVIQNVRPRNKRKYKDRRDFHIQTHIQALVTLKQQH